MRRAVVVALAVLSISSLVSPASLQACSLCGPLVNKQTLRQEMTRANLVVFGKLANAKLNSGPGSVPGTGSTDLHVQKVLKSHPALGGKSIVQIASYIPILDAQAPPSFVVFIDTSEGKLDVYHGRPAGSTALLDYLDGMQKLTSATTAQRLGYFYTFLDHSDSDIATDAFLEFAKTEDKEIAEIAPKLDPAKFRKLLLDPKTGSEKLGLFAFMLAASKDPKDADLLRGMIEKPTVKTQAALDGLLCGLIQLQPESGWKSVYTILSTKKSFNDRYAAFRTLRFYYNWNPKEYGPPVMEGLKLMLAGDMADIAIDCLRRWEIWEQTPAILALFSKEKPSAPLLRTAVVRYALSCPLPQAKAFVQQVSKTDPKLVEDVLDDLTFEKKLKQAGSQ